ncbi:MAG: polyprenyl synthetase family protein, partial [Candidatus Thermoplasmatota archaeon]|nr:polyprenyl synthetase family protein [Candidatus Thermoplasmatota archaeon]
TRRGLLSAPVLIGDELSILYGDALFTESFWLAATLGTEIATIAREAVREMVQGEAREMVHEGGGWAPDEAQLVAREKTASIIGAACAMGAVLAGAEEEEIQGLKRFGVLVGVAFQAVDDALDVSGEHGETGKPTGIDARVGAPNLAEALGEAGAEEARQLAKQWVVEAHEALDTLEASEHRAKLELLAEFIVDRAW